MPRKIWVPKVLPLSGVRKVRNSPVSWVSAHSLLHSFVHPFIQHKPLLRQAEVTQTQKRDSGVNKQVQICVKGGGRWTASARAAESSGSFVENRLPGSPSDRWLPVRGRAGNCTLKPLGAWRWLSPAPTWLAVLSGSGCAQRVALPRGRLHRRQPGTGSC